jgi:hypothetical protein
MQPPLSPIQTEPSGRISTTARKLIPSLLILQILPACAWLLGCGGGPSSGTPPPPPPLSINVTVTPTAATVLLGNSQTLIATVSNTTDTNVTWSVNGVTGGTTSQSASGYFPGKASQSLLLPRFQRHAAFRRLAGRCRRPLGRGTGACGAKDFVDRAQRRFDAGHHRKRRSPFGTCQTRLSARICAL